MESEYQHLEHEVEKLRDRAHEQGNHLQALIANVAAVGGKLDGIHISLKDDLSEIKRENEGYSERITVNEKAIARAQGIGIAVVASLPFTIYLLGTHLH
jgi:chromosome segregation ATPase